MASLIRERSASTAAMLEAFGDRALVAAALRFEAALAGARAAEGLIPAEAAEAIAAAAGGLDIPIDTLAEEAAHAGTLAIALVKRLREAVTPEIAAHVHHGATSQDLADTALMLQAKAAMAVLAPDIDVLAGALRRLAEDHAALAMTGRTLLQPALPTTFGLKAANWLTALHAAADRLRREAGQALALQLGGAAGTLNGMDGRGRAVAERMARELGLHAPDMHWQARRGDVAGLGAALAILTGEVGKMARDVSLLAQGEVGEAAEPMATGRGGSSAMSHKRNPTDCQVALSAAIRAPHLAAGLMSGLPQEHERGLGGWQAEAPAIAELFQLAHGAVAAMATVMAGLEIDARAMGRNLDAAGIGRDTGEAQAMVAHALAARRDGDS